MDDLVAKGPPTVFLFSLLQDFVVFTLILVEENESEEVYRQVYHRERRHLYSRSVKPALNYF